MIAGLTLLVLSSPWFVRIEAADPGERDTLRAQRRVLRQRTAEERWSRIQEQYQAPPEVAAVPPTPSEAPTSLRPTPSEESILQALSHDAGPWVLPVPGRTLEVPPMPAEAEPTTGVPVPRVAGIDPADKTEGVATADDKVPDDKLDNSSRRRSLTEITPFLDETSDGDIRKFAAQEVKKSSWSFENEGSPDRQGPGVMLAWEPTNLWHYPLYFEDVALERYGHKHWLQPVKSLGLMSLQLVGLPYQMTINEPGKKDYALGYYRPGDCAPKLHYQLPLNAHAAAVEAAFVTGFVFWIP